MDLDGLSERFGEYTRESGVPGAQLAILHDGRLWTAEFGVLGQGGPALTGEAAVPVGSITKTVTATVAMALVADGDLDLDEPVAEVLPELRRAVTAAGGAATTLTLRHLLSHTGGLPSECPRSLGPALAFGRLDLLQPPGTAFSYSNFGYALTGRMIAAVTGMTWYEAVELILLKPLGSTPAFVPAPEPDPRTPPVATGHAVNRARGLVRPVEQVLEPAEAPAGALAASATDLVTLGRLHLSPCHGGVTGSPVPPDRLAELRRPVPGAEPFGLADGWGLGLARYAGGQDPWLGHDGTADGTSCHLRIDSERGTVVALTTNGSTGGQLWQALVADLRAGGLPVGDYRPDVESRPRIPVSPGCAGRYHNGDIEYMVVVGDDHDDMRLIVDGEPAATLILRENLVFSVTDLNGEKGHPGRFLCDSAGEIDRIQIGGRIARRRPCQRVVA